MLLLWEAVGRSAGPNEEFAFAAPEPMPEVEPEMAAAFEITASSLRKHGIVVRPADIAPMLTKLADANRTLTFYEGARFHQQRFAEFGERLGQMATLVREGLQISDERYEGARRYIAESRSRMTDVYRTTPVILVPAAPGRRLSWWSGRV